MQFADEHSKNAQSLVTTGHARFGSGLPRLGCMIRPYRFRFAVDARTSFDGGAFAVGAT